MSSRKLATLALGSVGVFVAIILALHVVRPEFDPLRRFLSEYALGDLGWMMMVAFMVWALSVLLLAAALRGLMVTLIGRIGLAVLVIVSVSLVVAGLFPMSETEEGMMHGLAAMVGMPGLPLAALLVTYGLAKPRGAWLLWSAHATWLSLAAMSAYINWAIAHYGGFTPELMAGWLNRLVVAADCAWQIAACAYVLRRTARQPE